MLRPALAALAILLSTACGEPAPRTLSHEAYVWQRAWVPAVDEAVAAPPAAVTGLRVLAVEVAADAGDAVWPEVGVAALARSGRPVTAVVRIAGSRPIAGLSLAPLLERIAGWRAAGVQVAGVEIDHDCATAALADYAGWLEGARPPAPLRLSITALPTWAGAPADLARLAARVDEVVLQVHAVRAPSIFDADRAARWVARFAPAIAGRPLRIALPTYRVSLGAADPAAVRRFVAGLERSPPPNLAGFAWFRLPVAGDGGAWTARTLAAVIAGEPLRPRISAELIRRGPGRYDIAVTNRGTLDGRWPELALRGAVAADLIGGYTRTPAGWSAPPRPLRAGATAVVGWATGQEIEIDAR